MSPADEWLIKYGRHHNHNANRIIHSVTIPFVVMSLVGLLWSLPVPDAFNAARPVLNWGTIFLMAASVYYFIMSISLAFGVLPLLAFVIFGIDWLQELDVPLWLSSAAILGITWAGQRIGHQIEGQQPPLFEDIQTTMIGPVWLLANIYKRFGIPY
ncbi:MAG: DUF962 domain-containing protein [Candidatus Rariloculaceae bacterium]